MAVNYDICKFSIVLMEFSGNISFEIWVLFVLFLRMLLCFFSYMSLRFFFYPQTDVLLFIRMTANIVSEWIKGVSSFSIHFDLCLCALLFMDVVMVRCVVWLAKRFTWIVSDSHIWDECDVFHLPCEIICSDGYAHRFR